MSISAHLPSKKIRALIIIIVALFVTYYLYTLNVRGLVASWFSGSETPLASLGVATSTDEVSNVDTDKDGLKDWQEALWGTDSNKTDTDSDGTSDGEEVAVGRDPRVAGPHDELTKTRGIASSSISTFAQSVSDDPNNLSTSLSKDFFSRFMALQSTDQLNDQTQAELISQSISDINAGSLPPKYTTDDVKTVSTTKESLKAYGNAEAQLIIDLQNTIKNEKDNDKALEIYGNFITNMKSLSVPTLLGFNHLQLLNNANVSYLTLSYVLNYKDDPLKGLSALKSFDSNKTNAVDLYKNIASSMKKNDIIFNQSEPGTLWKNYY